MTLLQLKSYSALSLFSFLNVDSNTVGAVLAPGEEPMMIMEYMHNGTYSIGVSTAWQAWMA